MLIFFVIIAVIALLIVSPLLRSCGPQSAAPMRFLSTSRI